MIDIVSPARTRVLLALITVYQRDGRATVRDVAAAAGLASPNTAHRHLLEMRHLGLVQWEPDSAGTLRPAVAVVGTHVRSQGGGSTMLGAELNDPRDAVTSGGLADAHPLREEPST